MCIEREKVDFKSREVNCLKECALALKSFVKTNKACQDAVSPVHDTDMGYQIFRMERSPIMVHMCIGFIKAQSYSGSKVMSTIFF